MVNGCTECERTRGLVERHVERVTNLEAMFTFLLFPIVLGACFVAYAVWTVSRIENAPLELRIVVGVIAPTLVFVFAWLAAHNRREFNKCHLSLWGYVGSTEELPVSVGWHLHACSDGVAKPYFKLYLGRRKEADSRLVVGPHGEQDAEWRPLFVYVLAKTFSPGLIPTVEVVKIGCPETRRSVQLDRDLERALE